MAHHRFLLHGTSLDGDEVALSGDEARHLSARRIRPGELVIVSDGQGRERTAELIATTPDAPKLRYVGAVRNGDEERPHLTLVVGILKGDRLDWAIEKATELGAARIILLRSERVIADVSETRLSRLRRLAEAAAKQSQRATVPAVEGPMALAAALAATRDRVRVAFWEESAMPFGAVTADVAVPEAASVWIGPEGGFAAAEVAQMEAAGARVASLGTRPLRAETAVVAALAIVRERWSGRETEEGLRA